jgi:RNA polymerase sigma-70 factor (ECF subfamily)
MNAIDEPTRLLALTGTGDRAAFAQLYRASAPKLLGVIRRIVSDPAEAEDVLQDVYVRIWAAAPTYDATRGPALAWMAATARNRAIDRVRLASVKRTRSSEDLKLPEPTEGHGSDWLAEREMLDRCLGELGDEPRQCVMLAYVEGWSRDDLAARFGRPTGTIKSWISRALVALKACVDGEAV